MATQQYHIVSSEDSDIHAEPHVQGSRITVRDIKVRVEDRGRAPERVAERYDLDIAAVYEALAITTRLLRRCDPLNGGTTVRRQGRRSRVH